MTYEVVIQPRAEADIDEAVGWIAQRAPETAGRWLDGLIESIESLSELPERCSLAPESKFFHREIRQLLYGRKGRAYRALFTIVGREVHVLHFRHWAQAPLEATDLEGPE